MKDTIYALSSGAPPAAIGIIRISGPLAEHTLETLCGKRPEPRRAALRTVRSRNGRELDRALVLWFDGPNTATGEDLAEIHCHGGLAIVNAVRMEIGALPGIREALPGEFTRRAFENGQIDLAEAEALADLLTSETELQRQIAQDNFGGALSRRVEEWRSCLITVSADLEALLDFADEDDVAIDMSAIYAGVGNLKERLGAALNEPPMERLRSGIRVVLAGPPNSGKSSLFNAILAENAAIVSDISGTTRDVLERPVAVSGVPITLVDTAGVHEHSSDTIERIGIERSKNEFEKSDIVLWLGSEGEGPDAAWEIDAMCDRDRPSKHSAKFAVSSVTMSGVSELTKAIADDARHMLPKPNSTVLNKRQRNHIAIAHLLLAEAVSIRDPLLLAESLRQVRVEFDAVTGRVSTEDMLDALFGGFCIGK